MDWQNTLDLHRALTNVRSDIIGDWYRDPWGWPEYEHVSGTGWASVLAPADSSGCRRVALIDVPKENFAVRPAVVLEAIDRLLYQSLVDRLSKSLIGDLHPWVFGWGLPRRGPSPGDYSPNDTEWELYRSALSQFVATNDVGLKTDIVSCFSSMPIERVIEDIERIAGSGAVPTRLWSMIRYFDSVSGRSGLSQRSKASAVLANMYLKRVDEILKSAISHARSKRTLFFASRRGGVTRWMDDVWVFGSDDAKLRSSQVDIQHALRDAGLELNLAKTDVLAGAELGEAALSIQHSAVDDALTNDPPEVAPLEELLDLILSSPERADRTSIHFTLVRLRRHRLKSRKQALIDAAPRMPHGSDHLARAFRDFAWWRELQDWYLDYQHSSWAKFEWSVAGLGAMFPSRALVSTALHARFSETLLARPTLPLFALCAQRLASWDKARAREAIRAVAPAADHPHERRILGLAALQAGEERRFIRSLLSEYEENSLVLEMISGRSFRPIAPSPDFAGGGT